MTSFASAFESALLAKPKLSGKEMRLLGILQGQPGKRRDRQLARMERRVRTEFGIGEKEAIDWSAIDWPAILKTVLEILIKLLPLLMLI